MKIREVSAFQIFDSRGNPTIEAEVIARGRSARPRAGAFGRFDRPIRGFGTTRSAMRQVSRQIRGPSDRKCERRNRAGGAWNGCQRSGGYRPRSDWSRRHSEQVSPGSQRDSGGLAGRGQRRRSGERGKPLFESLGGPEATLLPLPEIQIIGGGAHADWRTDVQDFLVIASGAQSYPETLEITFNIYQAAKEVLRERKKYFGIADEGGFWPEFATNEEILRVLVETIQRAGYTPGKEAAISLDIAASDLFEKPTGKYHFRREDREFSSEQFVDLIGRWCDDYPILSIEDPLADTDWVGWRRIHASLGHKVQLIGDDLFTTNLERIKKGIEEGVANAVLIKLNQIGTVTETIDAIRLTQKASWLPVVSGRSGETEDAFMSHLAVATNAGQIKAGSFARSERMVKWNEVLRIERMLGERARFEGARIFSGIQKKQD